MTEIIVGIDPGVKTGVALWKPNNQKFYEIKTLSFIEAMIEMQAYYSAGLIKKIIFEDARLRGGEHNPKILQGVGSVKRDSALWQEFCEYYEISYKAVKPVAANTKWPEAYFKKMTGWGGRTSQHARDAAALVVGL